MDTFDIGRLTDFDFETVCKDLFEITLSLKLEIFAPGKDRGIDLRHLATPSPVSNDLVIQCKRWERTKFATLYNHIKNKELPKIANLNPDRYILATSVSMSVTQKDRLLNLLSPYVKSADDIKNVLEIEGLLRANPQIVQRHMRLWLSSSATLQAMLAKNILTRSGDLADEVKSSMLVYVPNDSFNRAIELLQTRRVCVITGIPGIGKTTLAQILTVSYAESGYDIFEISEDADEINSVWDDNAKQFFYYDDFLGQTSLEDRLHKNEDSRLIKIIRRINKHPNKRFVLTTREYILNQSRQKYERLASEDFNPLTCILNLGDYTPSIRAEILYNHLYFSQLPREEKAQFAHPDVYLPIIRHRNFNPRLIDYSLRLMFSSADEEDLSVPQVMVANLDDPRRIWEHVIGHQLNQESVDILVVLFSFTREAKKDELELAFRGYNSRHGRVPGHRNFDRALKVLDNTMIRIGSNLGASDITYHSASVRDYMAQYLAENSDDLRALIGSAHTFEQITAIIYQGTAPARAELCEQLRLAADEIEATVRRTWPSEPEAVIFDSGIRGWMDNGISRVAAETIDMASFLQSDSLAEFVADWLNSTNVNELMPDPSDLVLLVKSLWESGYRRLIDMRESWRDAAVEYLFEDVSDWDQAEHTENMLAELGDIAPRESIEQIQEIKHRLTERAFDRLTDYSQDEPYIPRELNDLVDFAGEYRYPDEEFPGYSVAADIIERRRADRPEATVPQRSIEPQTDRTDYRMISDMLGSLAEGELR